MSPAEIVGERMQQVSFATDIKPLFREIDVSRMKCDRDRLAASKRGFLAPLEDRVSAAGGFHV